jgi:RNA polymerase sigma factor (sigma-70 family)
MQTREYNQCVDEHSDGVYRFVLKNVRDEEMARDVVQEAFMKMWEKASTIDASKAKSYLYTTAYHTMIDMIRKEKRYTSDENVGEQVFSTRNEYSDLKEVIDEAFYKLNEAQRTVLLLRDYEGYSYKEIAEIMKISVDQVKVNIFRGRLNIKKYIGSLETVI